jgi:hypothetical protein
VGLDPRHCGAVGLAAQGDVGVIEELELKLAGEGHARDPLVGGDH